MNWALGNYGVLDFDRSRDPIRTTWTGAMTHGTEYYGELSFGFIRIPLDNSMYCGLLMDGWIRPYQLNISWIMSIHDERIVPPAMYQRELIGSERWLMELVRKRAAK